MSEFDAIIPDKNDDPRISANGSRDSEPSPLPVDIAKARHDAKNILERGKDLVFHSILRRSYGLEAFREANLGVATALCDWFTYPRNEPSSSKDYAETLISNSFTAAAQEYVAQKHAQTLMARDNVMKKFRRITNVAMSFSCLAASGGVFVAAAALRIAGETLCPGTREIERRHQRQFDLYVRNYAGNKEIYREAQRRLDAEIERVVHSAYVDQARPN